MQSAVSTAAVLDAAGGGAATLDAIAAPEVVVTVVVEAMQSAVSTAAVLDAAGGGAATLDAIAAPEVIVTVVVEAVQSAAGTAAVLDAAGGGAAALEAETAPLEAEAPATAAVISSSVASRTRRFSVKMQPTGSFCVSQVLPAPVSSVRLPGAKVPVSRATEAFPPIEAICCASARTIALLVAAAPGEAGSYELRYTFCYSDGRETRHTWC